MGMVRAGSQTAEPVVGRSVSTNFFTALGTAAWRGRVFTDGDEAAVVLAHHYWKTRFNGDDTVIGQVLQINGQPATIVGVAAPGFHGTGIRSSDIWLTFATSKNSGPVLAGGRVRSGVTVTAAATEVRAIGDAINREHGRPLRRHD